MTAVKLDLYQARRSGTLYLLVTECTILCNALGIPIAARALFPLIAELTMSLSLTSVIGNALRLRRNHA